ncbi:hypothetical protein GCM10009118_07850 [Wandonia haliotis]|uniref:Transposase DDE domain-containing protein n=1 Tax=Wandonia haliotis TaxID=574963 RepID=A0ABN1MMW6_9FLAO
MKAYEDILTTRYGGVIPIIRKLYSLKVDEIINKSANDYFPRAKQSKYKYSDVFLTWIAAAFCGATRIDHVTGLRKDLEVIPGLNVPSHDTMGRMMKSLVKPTKRADRVTQEGANENQWDDNVDLNHLLIRLTKQMGGLKESVEYTLDVDCTFINTTCQGANSMKDKNSPGFNPMICLIGNLPVFVNMRNGNSIADFRIKECIEQCLDLLDKENIKIKTVRTDGAGYRKELLTTLGDRGVKFVTASPVNAAFKKMFNAFDKSAWNKVRIKTAHRDRDCLIGEVNYKMTGTDTPLRIIALRIPTEDTLQETLCDDELRRRKMVQERLNSLAQRGLLKKNNKRFHEADWNEVRGYKYKMIATNDYETPAEELIYFYNQRGESERQFSFMKQDFGWKYPPFMKMNENTVFFIITAIANNIFRAIAEKLNEHIDDIELNARVRRFQKAFIDTVAICQDGQNWVFLSTKVDFEKIK